VSQSSGGTPPYRVAYSGLCLQEVEQLLLRARAKGRFAEIAEALRDVHHRLEWIPLDFGDPLKDFVYLGVQERLGIRPPLVVTFAVDEARRIVHVNFPFKLLPRSGL
jgi:hypothetical protein